MEFLTNPWVIGIGVAVIAGLILYFVFGIGKPKSRPPQQTTQQTIQPIIQQTIQPIIQSTTQQTTTIQQSNHPVPLPVPAQQVTTDITPQKIRDYLKTLPPLQVDAAAQNYKGITVSWKVKLHGATPLSNGKLYLIMFPLEPFPFTSVTCKVDPNQYPKLRVIDSTETFTVQGEIQEARIGSIDLKNCQFFF